MLLFITGNKNKFDQLKSVIPEIQQLSLDLEEIQELDAKIVIEHKLREALKKTSSEVIVEDTSLYIEGLGGLPGVFTKWFLESIGVDGIYKMAQSFNEFGARAVSLIGYAKNENEINFFEGEVCGKIVEPRGTLGFGWDPIFVPQGSEKTYGEMDFSERGMFSMRKIAAEKLKDYLLQ